MGRPPEGESYYAVLAVGPDATEGEVRRAYRCRVRELLPDQALGSVDVERFRAVRKAYKVLSDPHERGRYDLLMGLGRHAGRTRSYRRSFERLLDCLASGPQAVLNSTADLAAQLDALRRKAG